jgi:dienelactone hydrolase
MTKTTAILLALLCLAAPAAQVPEQDSRNTDVRDAYSHFTMPVFTSREAWLERAVFLRKQILASAGLLPLPEKTPIRAEVFGKLDRNGYSIEKVLLETWPGFYLGGNLYRPRGKTGPFPAVVSPHGHWTYGRLENQQLVSVPGRCINLAQQGFVVFTYDMAGYNDTDQIPHHWGGKREDLWNINPLGVQLWDSIRAVDFLSSLPDVDPSRIAATGASGGGTQTFTLMAVDDRIAAAAPVNMISSEMQGGICENAANLRVGGNNDTSNMVIAALMAPRPLLMISANDWTHNTGREEFPAVRSIYRLFGAEKNVQTVQIDQVHNYNQESREAMYTFFNARLQGAAGRVLERRFSVEKPNDLLALFGRLRPAGAVQSLEQFVSSRVAEARRGIDQLHPHDRASLDKARAAFRERLTFSLLALKPASGEVISEKKEVLARRETLLLGRAGKGDRIPAVWLTPLKANPAFAPTLIIHPEGLAWVLSSSQTTNGLVKSILDRGGTVMAIDAFQTGAAKAPRQTGADGFTWFNQTDDANRVQDILTALAYLQSRSSAQTVNLVGLEIGGVWSYFARSMAGPGVNLAADLAKFRTDADEEYLDRFHIPGLRKAGDFRAAAVVDTEGRLLLHNAGADFPVEWVKDSAQAGGVTPAEVRAAKASEAELLAWIAPGPVTVRPQVSLISGQDSISVEIDGKPFGAFVIGDREVNRPYLYPMRSASGKVVTRSYPAGQIQGETIDHPHQVGVFFGHGDVNGYNYWATLGPAPDPKRGRIILRKIVSVTSGKQSGTLEAVFDWLTPAGKPLLTEVRKMTFYSDPELRIVDFDIDLTATEKVVFGDTKEGTFAMRLATVLEEPQGPATGRAAAGQQIQRTGKMVNAQGREGEAAVWGKRSEWVDYCGSIDGEKVGVAFMDHPGNPRFPTYWHARSYGLLSANPFGVRDFLNDKTKDGSLTLQPGEHARFRYRVVVHPGDTGSAAVAGLYSKFAARK